MKQFRLACTAAACALMLQSFGGIPVNAADDSFLFSDGFETYSIDWKNRGETTLTVTKEHPYKGSGSLYITGRGESWNGAQKDISSVCEAGKTYSFSACARYETGSQSVNFMLSLEYKNSEGTTVYDHIAQASTVSGFYVQLYNDSYTVPAGATDLLLYIETESGKASFYLDEVICAPAGTEISGPPSLKFTLGDYNFDGVINAVDFTMVKRHDGKEFPNRNLLRAADVDQSGTADKDDYVWYQQYLTCQVTDYPEPVKPPVEPYVYEPLEYHSFPGNYTDQSSHPGQVIEEHYNGPQGTNTLYVYLPPDYDENQKYNIFYLLHGGNENEKTLFHQGDTMLQNIFDHMIENGDMEPMIIVTPTWNQSGAEGFWSEFRSTVVPFVEDKYSTYAESTDQEGLQASRMHRAYGGFSMGAVSTWAVITHCLDIVGYFMPLSGDEWEGTNSAYDKAKAVADAVDQSGLQKNEYFIMCATGSKDIAYPNLSPQVEEMKKMSQFVYTYDLSQGNFYFLVAQGKEHNWGEVRHYVYDVLPYFFHEGQ